MTEIGAEKNTTVVFPLPIDMVTAFLGNGAGGGEGRAFPSTPPAAEQPEAPTLADAPIAPPIVEDEP